MARDKHFSREYPILMLFRILDNYEIKNRIVVKDGCYIGLKKIRTELCIGCKRMSYALGILEEMNVLRIKYIGRKKVIVLNRKIVRRLQRGSEKIYE